MVQPSFFSSYFGFIGDGKDYISNIGLSSAG